jgi:hypothetical protein
MQEMNNNENRTPFEETVKNKLANYTQPVDDALWNEIETRLSKKSSTKKIAFFPWISGIAVAACVVLIWMLFPANEKPVTDEIVLQSTVVEEIITNPVATTANTLTVTLPAKQQKLKNIETTEKTVVSEEFAIVETVKSNNSIESDVVTEAQKRLYYYTEDPTEVTYSRSHKKTNTTGFHLGLGEGLLAMNDVNHSPAYSDAFFGGGEKITSNAPAYLADDIFYKENFSNVTHYSPIALGISFKKELNKTFALETGIVYTYLASKYENKNPKRDAVLQLHYLGIPVNLQVQVYRTPNKMWKFYFSLGTMVEKGLLSHYSQNEYYSNSTINITSNERIDGLQWSLNAALGSDYQLTKNYSLYFEPKVGYYLDNNQPISARTENPLIVGFNVGARYTW